jgi:hypothetical protein
MVHVALHIQHWHWTVFGHFVDVLIAEVPVALADGNAAEVAAENLPNLLGGVAMRNLGGVSVYV